MLLMNLFFLLMHFSSSLCKNKKRSTRLSRIIRWRTKRVTYHSAELLFCKLMTFYWCASGPHCFFAVDNIFQEMSDIAEAETLKQCE